VIPFPRSTACPKCGRKDRSTEDGRFFPAFHTRFCVGTTDEKMCREGSLFGEEHLHWRCTGCGYSFVSETKEDSEKADRGVGADLEGKGPHLRLVDDQGPPG
jgi:rubredoxin